MVAKKQRIRVVLDTNVFVRSFLAKRKSNPNKRIVRLWLLEKKLQLIVSERILAEYLGIFEDVLEFPKSLLQQWHARFQEDPRTTVVAAGTAEIAIRDPDDHPFLAAAKMGKADYLVSNDKDLLEIPIRLKTRLRFQVVTPPEFLNEIAK